MDIVQIIKGCKRKEGRYQKMLYERFYGYALKIAFRYVFRYNSSREVANDGFVKLFLQIEKFRYKREDSPERLLKDWIKQIIIHISIDELRRDNLTPEIADIPEYVWQEIEGVQNDDQSLLYKNLIGYVKYLPPVYRIVFNMFVIDGFTHFYIANSLGISVADSRLNLSRARDILQSIVDELEVFKSPQELNNPGSGH